jgi:hypothetical protein
MGVGSTACAAVMHGRRAAGADIVPEYIEIAKARLALLERGALKWRPMDRPVYQPNPNSALARRHEDPAPSTGRPARRRAPAQGVRLALSVVGNRQSADGLAEGTAESTGSQLRLLDGQGTYDAN